MLQEHWLSKQELSILNTIHTDFIAFGASAFDYGNGILRGRPFGGVAILIHRSFIGISTPKYYDDCRLIGLSIQSPSLSLLLICCYLPHNDGNNLHDYVDYLGKIYSIIDEWPNNNVIVGGDLNAHPNSDFGRELINWCEEMELILADVMLLSPDTFTFVDYGHGITRWLDHFIITPSLCNVTLEIDVSDKLALSDHLPISITCNIDTQFFGDENNDRNDIDVTVTKSARPKNCHNFVNGSNQNLSRIQIPVESLIACQSLGSLSEYHKSKISIFYSDIVDAIRLKTDACERIPDQADVNHLVGWNEFVRDDHTQARNYYTLWRDFGRPREGILFQQMRQSRAQFKRSLKLCRQMKDTILADRLANSMDINPNKFWSEIKRIRGNKVPLPGQIGNIQGEMAISSMWRETYSLHMNSYMREIDEVTQQYLSVGNYDDRSPVVSANDITRLLNKIKLGKAAGPSGLFSENLRYSGERLKVLLALLLDACLKSSFIPEKLLEVMISPVVKDKNGNITDQGNYRPIAVSNVISKLFELIILERCERYLKTEDNQFAFKQNHSTDQAIFMLKQVISQYRSNSTPVFVCFMDISKAYDKVNQGKLIRLLANRGLPPYILRILLSWFENQTFRVRWGDAVSQRFHTTCGLRQGSMLSPILFNVFMDDLTSRLNDSGVGLHIGQEWLNHMMYADDLVLVSPSASGLQNLISICDEYAKDHDIIYNTSKTVTMCILPSRYKINNLPKFNLCGRDLNHVDEYKYLGHYITCNFSDDRDISHRYRDVSVKGNIISRIFRKCSDQVKVRMFQSFCGNIYCNQLWMRYTQRMMNKIKVCYNNSFRILMRFPFDSSASDMFSNHNVRSFNEVRRFGINSLMIRISKSKNKLLSCLLNTEIFYQSEFFNQYMVHSLA